MRRIRAFWLTLREIPGWLDHRGLGWMTPLVFLLVTLGGLMALAAASPVVSSFVYLLF